MSTVETHIEFGNDHDFSNFRNWISLNYAAQVANVKRHAVYANGRTLASIRSFPGLVAEIRGKAYSSYFGQTVESN